MATRQAYKKKVTLAYVNGNEYTQIESSKIVYIIIEYMYERRVMPVIYLSVAVETDLYAKILENKDTAKMYLRVQRYDAYSNTALYKDDINKQFTYFLSSTTPEYSQDLADANSNVDSAYKVIVMGLLDMTIMNTLRVSFGGIKKNIDTYNLIYSAVENTKIVMKTPKYNTTYDSLYVPSVGSRKDMLMFLFNEDPFYDTSFLYFIDYDVSYLLDESGDALSANDGTLDNVVFDIKKVTAEEAYYEGMEIRDNGYYIYINPANSNVSLNMGTEKVANQLVASYIDSSSNTVDLNINTNSETTTKQVFNRFKSVANSIVYKNAVESAQVVIEIAKEFIDSSIITPNKSFTINNYEGYSDYNGRYLLVYKKDVIQGTSTDFACVTTIGLKKLGNVQEVGLSNFGSSGNSKTTKSTALTSTYSTRTTTNAASSKTTTTSSN